MEEARAAAATQIRSAGITRMHEIFVDNEMDTGAELS